MVFSPKENIVEWCELNRAEVGKEVNEVWSKPLISFQRLPKVVGTWCKAFMSSPPLLYILKTMDPRQEPRPPRSYHSIWQGCEVLTSEGCSEVMCLSWLAESIRTICSVHHEKGTFLGMTLTAQITPSPIHAGIEHCFWPLLRASHLVPMTTMRWSCLGQSGGNRCVLDRSLLPQVDKSPSRGTGVGRCLMSSYSQCCLERYLKMRVFQLSETQVLCGWWFVATIHFPFLGLYASFSNQTAVQLTVLGILALPLISRLLYLLVTGVQHLQLHFCHP